MRRVNSMEELCEKDVLGALSEINLGRTLLSYATHCRYIEEIKIIWILKIPSGFDRKEVVLEFDSERGYLVIRHEKKERKKDVRLRISKSRDGRHVLTILPDLKIRIDCKDNLRVLWSETFEFPSQTRLLSFSHFAWKEFGMQIRDHRKIKNNIMEQMKEHYNEYLSLPLLRDISLKRESQQRKCQRRKGEEQEEEEEEEEEEEGEIDDTTKSDLVSTSPYNLSIEDTKISEWRVEELHAFLRIIMVNEKESLYDILLERTHQMSRKIVSEDEDEEEGGEEFERNGLIDFNDVHSLPLILDLVNRTNHMKENQRKKFKEMSEMYFGHRWIVVTEVDRIGNTIEKKVKLDFAKRFREELYKLKSDGVFDITEHLVIKKCLMKGISYKRAMIGFQEVLEFKRCKKRIKDCLVEYCGRNLDKKNIRLPVKLIIEGFIGSELRKKIVSKLSRVVPINNLPLGVAHTGILIGNVYIHFTSAGSVKLGKVGGKGHPQNVIFAGDLGTFDPYMSFYEGDADFEDRDILDEVCELLTRAIFLFNRDSRYQEKKIIKKGNKCRERKKKSTVRWFSLSSLSSPTAVCQDLSDMSRYSDVDEVEEVISGRGIGKFHANCQEFCYWMASVLGLEFKFPHVVTQYIENELCGNGNYMMFRFSTMQRFSEFGKIFELEQWMDFIQFESHEKLDEFAIYLFSKRPDFPILFPGVYELLKGFDRAFWLRARENVKEKGINRANMPYSYGCPFICGNWRKSGSSITKERCMEKVIVEFEKKRGKPRWMKKRRTYKNRTVV